MRLREWLSTHGKSAAEFGRRIETSRAAVERYASGKRMPRPAIMARIERVTGGQVTAADFYLPLSEAGGGDARAAAQPQPETDGLAVA